MPDDLSIPHSEEEGDVCRVCRVEGDEDNPLIHPCKCAGSVRFVHPDCLKLWLAQSQKKYCEICGHRYTFTKVYPDQLPTTIPITVYIRQTLLYILRYNLIFARLCLVIIAWLVALPSLNLFSLRSMIWLADHIGLFGTSDANTLKPGELWNATATYDNGTIVTLVSNASEAGVQALTEASTLIADGAKVIFQNISAVDNASIAVSNITTGITVGDLIARPASTIVKLLTISVQGYMRGDEDTAVGFVLRGQILSVTITAILIGLILLREWIAQHNWEEHERPRRRPTAEINPEDWDIRHGQAHRKTPDWTQMFKLDESGKPVLNDNLLQQLENGPIPLPTDNAEVDRPIDQMLIADEEMNDIMPPPGSIAEAIQAYRAHHRQLQQATAGAEAEAEKSPQNDGQESQAVKNPAQIWAVTGEAGPSTQRTIESLFTPNDDESLSPTISRPMSASSSDPGQKQRIDVAFTAPELLSRSEKGKERAGDIDELDNGAPLHSDTIATPSSPVRRTEGEESAPVPTEILEALGMLDADIKRAESLQTPPTLPPDIELPEKTQEDESAVEEPDTDANEDADDDGDEGEWEDEADEEADGEDGGAQGDGEGGRVQADGMAGAGPAAPQRGARWNLGPVEVEVRAGDEMEAEAWDGEDWNGILEVIGLVGPLHNLLQNVLFAVIIMGASLTLLVGVPLILGKIFLSFDFIRSVLRSGAWVIRLMRKVTDPVVDIAWEIAKEVLVLPLWASMKAAENIVARKLGLNSPAPNTNILSRLLGIFPISSTKIDAPADSSALRAVATSTGDIFAFLGQYTYDFYDVYLSIKHNIATSDRVSDRVACMFVGYGVAGMSLALVALAGEAGFGRASGDLAASIRHHGMFLKLAFFMVLELAAFPLGIGLIINGCTIPLFEGVTIASRIEHLRSSPFGAVFVNWLVGTIFMYQFATLLSHIRTLCRPGTLFFIRDPSDPSYSPVKDIVEKSSLSQLRKLGISAMMYSTVVFCLFGVASWGLAYQPFVEVLPLRMDPKYEPLTSIPFDLLFLHLMLSPAINFARPRQRGRKLLALWWKWTVSMYRLTPLMGKRSANTQPQAAPGRLEVVWGWLDPVFQIMFGKYDPTSTDARVPASDQVALLPPAQRRAQGGVFVPLDEDGVTRTNADKLRLLRQDKLARDNGRDPRKDYKIIRLPQYWRTRVHFFIGSALAMSSAVIGVIVFLPLFVGRLALGWNRENGVHDGYNYLVGTTVLLFSLSLGHSARKHILLSTRAARLRRSDTATRIKRTVKRWLAGIYGVILTYGVLPIMIGGLLEVYGVGMSKGLLGSISGKSDVGVPVVHFWDIWANGTVICSLFMGSLRVVRPGGQLMWLDLVRERLRNPAPKYFGTTNLVLFPTIKWLSIPLLLPLIASWAVVAVEENVDEQRNSIILRTLVPICFVGLVIRYGSSYLAPTLIKLRQEMIDAEYVLEERVENYIPEPEPTAEVDTTEKVKGDEKVGQKDEEENWAIEEEEAGEWMDVQ